MVSVCIGRDKRLLCLGHCIFFLGCHNLDSLHVKERGSIYDSLHVKERGSTYDSLHVKERGSMYDSLHVKERGSMYDSLHVKERGSMYDSLHVKERGSTYDSLHVKERGSMYDSLHVKERGSMYDSLHVKERGSMYDSLHVKERGIILPLTDVRAVRASGLTTVSLQHLVELLLCVQLHPHTLQSGPQLLSHILCGGAEEDNVQRVSGGAAMPASEVMQRRPAH